MTTDLRSEGLVYTNLFKVDGELVDYYNRSLEKITGKRTALTEFHIDRRGKSPEIVKELGGNYLETTPSNRYMIVVSPEQASCELVDAEFTFDEDATTELFTRHQMGMSVVTRVDGMYGELSDGVRAYDSLDDLLGIKSIDIRLHTPSGFITSARELLLRLEQLEKDPRLLIERDAAHINRMIALVQQVGDVRGYPITDISVSHEIGSFGSTLYGGLFLFNTWERKPVKLKRPGRDANGRFAGKNGNGNGDEHTRTVIYNARAIENGTDESINHIDLNDLDEVASYLLTNEFAAIDPSLIVPRQRRIDDLALIGAGRDPSAMSREERQRYLAELPRADLRQDLADLRTADQNDRLTQALPEASVDAVIALLRPHKGSEEIRHVTEHLLTLLRPYDYETAATVAPSDLERTFGKADAMGRKYIINTLKTAADPANGR